MVRRRALSVTELVAAFEQSARLAATAKRWAALAHDPIALAIYAAGQFGWTFVSANVLLDPHGHERSLALGTPQALKALLLADVRQRRAGAA